MFQRDFILRMVELLGEVMARILTLIRKGEFVNAEILIENAYMDFLKHDASFFRNLENEKITSELIVKHSFTNSHLEILAELFNAEAELCFSKNNDAESLKFYQKALILLKFVENNTKTFSVSRRNKVQHIILQTKKLSNNYLGSI